MQGIFRSLGVYPDDCNSCVESCLSSHKTELDNVYNSEGYEAYEAMHQSLEQACKISQCTQDCYSSKNAALQDCYAKFGSLSFWAHPLDTMKAAVEGLVCDSSVADVISAYGLPPGGRPGSIKVSDTSSTPATSTDVTTVAAPPVDVAPPAPGVAPPASSVPMSQGAKIALGVAAAAAIYALWKYGK